MKKLSSNKGGIVFFVLVVLVVGYFYYLSNRNVPQPEESISELEVMTATQQVLARDLSVNYPPTPREVIKYYSEITQCFYNEELSEEDIYALGMKARELYDAELVANQTEADYMDSLKYDIQDFKSKKRTIASYEPSSSLDVETFSEDGYEWARLYCNYGVKQGELLHNSNMVFILRKDENEHYKIYGWKLAKEKQKLESAQ
ncbi:MAG: hypothetical protein E7289_01195 [Lachnospiraceae bacterium]|nr:hypothetical protein [Lachnospiraceae bacterium]